MFIRYGLLVAFFCLSLHTYAGNPQDLRLSSRTNHSETALTESAQADDFAQSYNLQNGDRLDIHVYGESDLSRIYTIDDSGMISVPLIGAVRVAGMNRHDVSGLLHEKLSDGYLVDPDITVTVARYKPVVVMGEVRAPGEYDFEPGMTVLTATAIAGGFTYRANQKTVEVLRKNHDNPSASYHELPVESDLQGGDVILVKERFF